MAAPQQQSPEDRLKAVREIGLSALSAIDLARGVVREGRGERTLEAIARANTERVGDEAIAGTLRSELDTFSKLVNVAERAGSLAMEIEASLLPEGWMVRETILARTYSFQGGNAQVSISKEVDRDSMSIQVFGARTWSGYVGESTGYVPLREALKRAEETLANPSSHLSQYGVELVEKAKAEHDKSRAEMVATLRRDASAWAETADRYKNALIGERFMVVDRHERAFSQTQVDGESQIKLELPSAALTGVSFMTQENAEKVREHLEMNLADAAPYAVWDFQEYAQKQAGNSTELANLAAAAKWTSGREAKTLLEARELAEVALIRLGLQRPESWRESQGSVSPWEYADVDVGGHKKLTVGASAGGVVSLDGDPYTPGDRKINTTLANVERSVSAAQQGLSLAVPLEEIEKAPANPRAAGASLLYLLNEIGDGVDMEKKYEGMNGAQQEFVDRVSEEGAISRNLAVIVADKLGELGAAHVALAKMDLEKGLTVQQKVAQEAIEEEVRAAVRSTPGMKEAVFMYDPRGTTVGVKFESGAYNSFNGSWKVPLADGAVKALDSDFWEKYVPKPDVTPDEPLESLAGAVMHLNRKTRMAEVVLDDGGVIGFGGVPAITDWVEENSISKVDAKRLYELDAQGSRREELSAEAKAALARMDAVNLEAKTQASGFVVLNITETGNAAFVDVGRDQEIARIIEDAAGMIRGRWSVGDVEFPVRDTNGNRVGEVSYTEEVPTGEPEAGAVRLAVATGNAAFEESATEEVARILQEAAGKVRDGEHIFALRDINGNTVGKFEFREEPSLDKDGVIDMNEALNSGRVYLGEDGFSGIADGEYRYVVTTPDFEPGYGQGEGDVWLVNAKGEIAPGYEEPQSVREMLFRELKRDEKSDLRAVVEGRATFEDFERRFSGEEPELG